MNKMSYRGNDAIWVWAHILKSHQFNELPFSVVKILPFFEQIEQCGSDPTQTFWTEKESYLFVGIVLLNGFSHIDFMNAMRASK